MTNENGQHDDVRPDPLVIRIGRRRTDVEIVLDWHSERGLVKCNLAYVQGDVVYLEEIPTRLIHNSTPQEELERTKAGQKIHHSKVQMGMVLIHRKWGKRFYFMNERKDWTENDYFERAEELIEQRKRVDEDFHS